MSKEQFYKTTQGTNRLAARARLLYMVIPAAAIASLVIISSLIFRAAADDYARRLARQYSIEAAANFQISVHPHFVLMQQLARSTTISRWLANEDDLAAKAAAFNEIMGYAVFSPQTYLMFTVYETLRGYNFYVDSTLAEFMPWGRLSGGEASQWFFNTRDAEIPFILNIQRVRGLTEHILYVWTNHRMYYQGRFAGVVTVGFPFERIFEYIFGHFDVNYKRGYIIDQNGAVRVDSARVLVVTELGLPALPSLPEALYNPTLAANIDRHLQSLTDGSFQIGHAITDAVPLRRGIYRYASIVPIIGTNWSVVVLSNHLGVFGGARYIPLILSAFAVLILFVLVGSVLVRRVVLVPLFKLTQSAADSASTSVKMNLFGLDRDDEIGDLARTVQLMRDNLNSTNEELKENERLIAQAHESLLHRERLLNTANRAAEVLLTASEKNTLQALTKGMELLGHCMDADRVQIWRNEIIDDELHFVMSHEWLSEIGRQKKEIPIGFKIPCSSRPRWLRLFLRGTSINTPVSKLTAEDAAFLGYYEMLSIVIVPLFLDKEFVGFFCVNDCRRERVFTEDEMEMLESAGLMFTAVFNRISQTDKIVETNKQLELALDRALSASNAKSFFLSSMSHEMRTPMNAIIGMTSIARKEANNERKNLALSKVDKAAHHLLGIINHVLDMSKIEAGMLVLQQAEVDIRNLLQKVTSVIEFRIKEKRHRFSIHFDKNIPPFYNGDEQRLMQILINLLANAISYTPEEGEISLDVSLQKNEGGMSELRFVVADNGIGISPEDHGRLFEKFEHLNNTHRTHGGAGLGLAISKRLIELMGGTIVVESAIGKGSRFMFTVKLASLERPEMDFPVTVTEDASILEGDMDFTGKRLLLAEDIEINREILLAQLDGTGLLIDIAENGREAVEMVAANPDIYDMVFMDMQMPEMDGLEATRHIRSLPANKRRSLPIVALTANVFADDVEKCLAAGMNDHVGKPLDMRIVFEKLNRYL